MGSIEKKYLRLVVESYGLLDEKNITPETFWTVIDETIDIYQSEDVDIYDLCQEIINHFKIRVQNSKKLQQLFDSSPIMCMHLLQSIRLNSYIFDGYRPHPLRPDVDTGVDYKIIWITQGWDKKCSSKYRAHDYFIVDYSIIDDRDNFIKDELIRYTVTKDSISYVKEVPSVIKPLSEFFKYLNDNNLNFSKFGYSEISFLYNQCKDKKGGYSYHIQSYLIAFLRYLNDKNPGILDTSNLKVLKTTSKVEEKKNAIPDEDYAKLEERMRKGATGVRGTQYYAIFILLRTTNMRLGTILSLDCDDIIPAHKEGQYLLRCKTKKSKKKETGAISNLTYSILSKCIEYSKEKADSIHDPKLKNKIFLYYRNGKVGLLYASLFENYLKDKCKEAGIPYYSPITIRKLYMTKADDYGTEHGFTELDRTMMTGHQSHEVTIESYFDPKISKLVEGLYHVTIGDKDILDRIDARNKIGDVELEAAKVVYGEVGLGYCKAECKGKNLIACYCCENFYTTPSHLPVFKTELEKLKLIKNSTINEHDIETIELKETILCIYIAAIYEHMGVKNA